MDIGQLNDYYRQGETVDTELFAEQRSNLLLVSGRHYANINRRFKNNLRRTENITREQKIRLTKNHIQRISKAYVNSFLSRAPGVCVMPNNESEIQDQKAAELNGSVWEYVKKAHNMKHKIQRFIRDFVDVGEVWCVAKWDTDLGRPVPGQQIMDPETGEVIQTTEQSGDMYYDRILGMNMIRDPDGQEFELCRWFCSRKMHDTNELKRKFKDDPDKLQMIHETKDKTYMVFDSQLGSYLESKNMSMLREFYFRPNSEIPNGYFYITTEEGILYEGELPSDEEGVLFPVLHAGFDELATRPRSISIIRQLRPYQAELNRAASKVAEHQITLGDDKIILNNGSSITAGGTAHGIKAVKVTGGEIKVLPGRSGEQYLGYMQQQITEMYQTANVPEQVADKQQAQQDVYALLHQSMSQKKEFMIYSGKIEKFLVDLCSLTLRYMKLYAHPQMIVPMIGKKEAINMDEFKNSEPISYQIKLEPQNEDIETKMGKQLTMAHIMQYASGSMDKEDIGKLIRAMPYANDEELLSDLTLDFDNAKNDMLALDRGKPVEAQPNDNHSYMLKKFVNRTKQSDFETLNPEIQQMYFMRIQQHEQFQAQQIQAQQMAASGFIPSGGHLVAVEFYVQSPKDPTKTRRARIPYESLDWLVSKLEQQGSNQEILRSLDPSVVQDMVQQGMLAPPQGGENVVNMPPR